MGRKATIIDVVTDYHGDDWDVREKRFGGPVVVMLGWPQSVTRGRGGQGPSIIPTQNLINYLSSDRPRSELPIGRTTIKSLVKKYNIKRVTNDPHLLPNKLRYRWWEDRLDDLLTLSAGDFARHYNVSHDAVLRHRQQLGLSNDQRGPYWWWEDRNVRDLLLSPTPVGDIAESLSLAAGSVRRMQWMSRQIEEDPDWRRKHAARKRIENSNTASELAETERMINERINDD